MCAKEKTASFVSVAPLKASKDQEVCPQIWSHAAAVTPLLPFHCTFSTSLLFLWFTVHFLHFTRGSTCTTGVHKRTDNPTEKPNTLIISSFSLFFNTIYIEKRKISAVRASWISNFRTVIQKHINYHYYKRCARLTTALCAPPRSAPEVPLQVLQIMLAISRNFPVRFALLPCQIFLLSSLLTSSNSHV